MVDKSHMEDKSQIVDESYMEDKSQIVDDAKPYDGRIFTYQTLYCEGAIKPEFRGYIHYFILFSGILVYAIIEILKVSKTPTTKLISVLFMMSFVACYVVSTIFHICESDKETEILLQKLDHVAISFFMYFTIVSISLILPNHYRLIMVGISTGFLLLNLYNIFNSPSNVVYEIGIIGIGVLFLPVLYQYMTSFEWVCALSIVVLDVIAGYVFFKEQNLGFVSPEIFGYHEIFHLLTSFSKIPGYLMIHSIFDRTSSVPVSDNIIENVL
jgi:channel protein (hemolysin III family)